MKGPYFQGLCEEIMKLSLVTGFEELLLTGSTNKWH